MRAAQHRLALRYNTARDPLLDGHPTAVDHARGSITHFLHVEPGHVDLDRSLRASGEAHLTALRHARPTMFDGPVLNMIEASSHGIRASAGHYFDMVATCASLGAEFDVQGPLPLRDRADQVAVDPIRRGTGRAAAVGLSVVVSVDDGADRAVLIGRRLPDLASDAARRHVIPSGMLEPGSPDPVVDGARRELAEELGVELSAHDLAGRVTLLGVAHDLLRLRPEICLRLDLDAAESAQIRGRRPPSEFASVERVGFRDLTNFLESSAAADLTPAGVGALALLASA